MNLRCQVVIPARLASTRLPEKLLRCVAGKSILQHTFEAASGAESADSVVIAVDDARLADLCDSFGAPWIMTSPDCASGTDRIAEAAVQLSDTDVFINVQGDEPEISAQAIDAVASAINAHPMADMATAGTPIRSSAMLKDPNVVKIVMGELPGQTARANAENKTLSVDGDETQCKIGQQTPRDEDREKGGGIGFGRAIYFSRAPVPHQRDQPTPQMVETEAAQFQQIPPIYWHHLGLYAYRQSFLEWFAEQPPGRLECVERLEQLRAIEAGKLIVVAAVPTATPGIDTEADFEAFRQRRES